MSRFSSLPIRTKLLLLTLASSVTALALASSGFFAWDIAQYRSEIRQELDAQANIIADNSSAAIAFGDNATAAETLAGLQLRPRVEVACLYTRGGSLFASFRREDTQQCPAVPPGRPTIDTGAYHAVATVTTDDGPPIGTLYIRRDLADLYSRIRFGLSAVGVLLVTSILAALLISARLQQWIAAPLLDLATTARAVSADGDYSLRATVHSGDEVGVVVRAFNAMLDRLAARNTELSRANADLAHEVQERRRIEAERTAALERERDANRLKDEFLATLSHELRTPLNAVLGWSRILRSARLDATAQARALDSIERNAQAQARLIEDLLEVSRIVTGKLRIDVEDVDLAALVDAAVEVVQPAASARGIRLISEVRARPAPARGDPNRLQQVVWNLLSNAVKFTPEGGEVSIQLDRDAGYRIVVADTGQGIEPRFLPHVFEPFRQADGSASRQHGGLGLGLAIARQLVELHGGRISARSRGAGQGAEFEVRLPAAAASRTSAVPAPPDVTVSGVPDAVLLQGIDILIVDDEDDARLLLETVLAQYGARVRSADSAEAALQAVISRPPAVLLSDIGMPGQDGYALIRRIRELAGEAGRVPAVAITAYASARDRATAFEAGYQAHIAKPYEPGEVASVVARLARAAVSQ